jgi:short-subunit dehydrogenase
MKTLVGKTAFITGAGSGIGKAIALQLAQHDCQLILLDIDETALNEVKDQAYDLYKVDSKIIVADLTSKNAISEIAQEYFDITDILINNAGIGSKGLFVDRTIDEFERIAAINYLAVVRLSERFLKATNLIQRERALVTISSPAGLMDIPYMSAYSSSKRAVTSFMNCLSFELEGKDVQVTTVFPGPTATNFGKEFSTTVKHGWFYNKFVVQTPETIARSTVTALLKRQSLVYVPSVVGFTAWFSATFPVVSRFVTKLSLKKVTA